MRYKKKENRRETERREIPVLFPQQKTDILAAKYKINNILWHYCLNV
jgi:hypothetical protein